MSKTFTFLEMITIGFAFAAAWFWLRSAQSFGADVDFGSVSEVKEWLGLLTHYNHAAALCSALSALANGALFVAVRFGL